MRCAPAFVIVTTPAFVVVTPALIANAAPSRSIPAAVFVFKAPLNVLVPVPAW